MGTMPEDSLPQRIPEPELMVGDEQAAAYAGADFTTPHNRFINLFAERFPGFGGGAVLDLGCGPADITLRFARRYPAALLTGLDGAKAMLNHGVAAVARAGLASRIQLRHARLPLPDPTALPRFPTLIANSLLHHLHDPMVLWQTLLDHAEPGAAVCFMDLLRPSSREEAAALVSRYSGAEPEMLRHDFYHSLLAAFRIDEVCSQLVAAGIEGLGVEQVSDRHLLVWGVLG